MKKVINSLVVGFAAVMLVASTSFATCGGWGQPECTPSVNADIQPQVEIHGTLTILPGGGLTGLGTIIPGIDNNEWAGSMATADVVLKADASATGMDTVKKVRVGGSWWHPVYDYVTVPGESESYGRNEFTMSSDFDVDSNSPQVTGLAFTAVNSVSTLDINGIAWAEGTKGCPQEASIDIEGSLSAYVYGASFSGDPTFTGAFASAGGAGITTVSFEGYENDFSNSGGFFGFGSNKAEVDFDSTVIVNQGLVAKSYVNEAGTESWNFAKVGGGSAELELGRDGWFGRDDIELTGIQAAGRVSQTGMATDGFGSYASGSSQAFFSGAVGSVAVTGGGWCSPATGMTANVGGYAIVGGKNTVVTVPGSITVTSTQYAYATTGNNAPAPQ